MAMTLTRLGGNMTWTGCDLAAKARDAAQRYNDADADYRNEITTVANDLRFAINHEPAARLVTICNELAARLESETLRAIERNTACKDGWDDDMEAIRTHFHEAVNERAESAHEDCYDSDSVSESVNEAVRTLKRNIIAALTDAVNDAESY
jgi:hypothetical protein